MRLAALLVVTLLPAAAFAKADSAAQAKADLAAKRWDAAVRGFEAAWAADRNAEHLRGLGRAREGKADLPGAIEAFERYLAADPSILDGDEIKARIRRLEGRVQRHLGRLLLETAPSGAAYTLVRGKERIQGNTPLSRWLRKGTWELTVAHPGHMTETRTLDIAAGSKLELSVPLVMEDF